MRRWHFLKSTGDMGTPRQGPQCLSRATNCISYNSDIAGLSPLIMMHVYLFQEEFEGRPSPQSTPTIFYQF